MPRHHGDLLRVGPVGDPDGDGSVSEIVRAKGSQASGATAGFQTRRLKLAARNGRPSGLVNTRSEPSPSGVLTKVFVKHLGNEPGEANRADAAVGFRRAEDEFASHIHSDLGHPDLAPKQVHAATSESG
jgi:hypothetical protein